MLRRALLSLVTLAILLTFAEGRAAAHGMRSIYVEVVEQTSGRALVTMRTPVPVSGVQLTTRAPCRLEPAPDAPAALVLSCTNGTVGGATLAAVGLGPIIDSVVVWTVLIDGASASTLISRERHEGALPTAHVSSFAVARQYVGVGVRHIATGFDHLCFLLGLVVALRRVRAVLWAETAFTLSHTISITAATLGWVRVSAPAVEACIALSLVLVAAAAMSTKRAPATDAKRGAGLAFVFGLIHGLGFAGGLGEIGLPAQAVPAALTGFSVGVEIGQLAFVAVVLAVLGLARRWRRLGAEPLLARACSYGVGVAGSYWLIERMVSLLSSPRGL
jgi:hypothetical protein